MTIKPSLDDIQRAHDLLHAVAAKEVILTRDPKVLSAIHATHDAMGWILGYECGATFTENLAQIEATADALGYELKKRT